MSSGMSHINLGTLGLVQTGFFYSFFFLRSKMRSKRNEKKKRSLEILIYFSARLQSYE